MRTVIHVSLGIYFRPEKWGMTPNEHVLPNVGIPCSISLNFERQLHNILLLNTYSSATLLAIHFWLQGFLAVLRAYFSKTLLAKLRYFFGNMVHHLFELFFRAELKEFQIFFYNGSVSCRQVESIASIRDFFFSIIIFHP